MRGETPRGMKTDPTTFDIPLFQAVLNVAYLLDSGFSPLLVFGIRVSFPQIIDLYFENPVFPLEASVVVSLCKTSE